MTENLLSGSLPLTRIFVVDDEPVIAFTLAEILSMHGLEVRAFVNPLEALEASRTDNPDLLISDVAMPELNGIDLAIRLRVICPACKVLLLSGQAHTSNLLRLAEGDGSSFELLTKPIHPSALMERITLSLASQSPQRRDPHVDN